MKYTREQLGNHVGFPFTFPPEHLELYPSIKSIEGMDGYVECLDSYRGIIFDHITAPKSTFHTVSLEGASFIQAELSGTDFSRSKVTGALFDGADLAETKWANGDMSGAILQRCRPHQGQYGVQPDTRCRLHECQPGGCRYGLV